jgi:hypothetical protein
MKLKGRARAEFLLRIGTALEKAEEKRGPPPDTPEANTSEEGARTWDERTS